MFQPIATRFLFAITVVAAVTGCSTTKPRVPSDWRIASEPTAGIGAHATVTGAVVRRTPNTGVMQLIVAYGPVLQTHAAVRLQVGTERIVHWDPGGDFGRRDPGFNRVNDVMSGASSSLQRIWHFRRSTCGNDAMLVFEFDQPIEHVAALQDTLVNSAKRPNSPDAFKTRVTPSQCVLTVCKFLQERSPGQPLIHKRWLYPHELGKHLWTQNPDRVILYRLNQRPAVFIPPANRDRRTAAR